MPSKYRRECGNEGTYVGGSLEDFGRTITIVLKDGESLHQSRLHREEAQQLFNDLWRYGFRPEGMSYCEGNHGPK